MIIARTPFRFSFLGGGTDYPNYYKRERGIVLGTTINKYSYISLYPILKGFFNHRIRIKYSKLEKVNNLDDIEHPSVRECLKIMGIKSLIEIDYLADLPARTGLGTSSAFTVGLLNALHTLQKKSINKKKLAEMAIHVEQNLIKERVGSQDQYHAAYGGLNMIEFNKKEIKIKPLSITDKLKNELDKSTMMFYTGITRHSHKVLKEQIKKTNNKANDSNLRQLYDLTINGIKTLEKDESIIRFAKILDEGWQLKKKLSSKVTNPIIDQAYKNAKDAGAWGGKLAGAGSGGFIFLLAPPKKQKAIKKILKNFTEVDFKFDNTGSKIIYNNPLNY